ncbi:YlxR family protein [Aceticella autotrophica]|uniref:YlxR family protein n=1 Tax=Aceticella autotrophica TaxID=2755338 RepID=A0A975GBA7_9THEO|nr:YlxR family protein [Aceticella autotrophica]QSZ28253.1 YlxR family protein [Aceticella autotrophica]
MKTKKVPLRMCLGCQQMKPKRDLIRIVKRAKDNGVQVDFTGKISGRGCYICKNIDCLEKAIKTKRIEKSLECKVPDDLIEVLRKEVIDE